MAGLQVWRNCEILLLRRKRSETETDAKTIDLRNIEGDWTTSNGNG